MRWQLNDILLNPKKPEIIYKVLDIGGENYLLKILPMSVRVVLPHGEVEGPEWTKYEGEKHVKNTVSNNGKSSKKKRGNERCCTISENSKSSNGRNKSRRPSTSSSVDSHSRQRTPSRSWWKKKEEKSSSEKANQ